MYTNSQKKMHLRVDIYFLTSTYSTMNLLSDTLQEKQFKFVVVGEPACGKVRNGKSSLL